MPTKIVQRPSRRPQLRILAQAGRPRNLGELSKDVRMIIDLAAWTGALSGSTALSEIGGAELSLVHDCLRDIVQQRSSGVARQWLTNGKVADGRWVADVLKGPWWTNDHASSDTDHQLVRDSAAKVASERPTTRTRQVVERASRVVEPTRALSHVAARTASAAEAVKQRIGH